MQLARIFLPILSVFALAATAPAAEDGEVHPIDKFYEECVENNGSTAGMVECADKAYKKWDAELNKVYGELMKKLPAAKSAELKKSQRDWIVYRDSTFKLISAVYSGLEGTMYVPMQAYARLRIVRERTTLLAGYLDLLNGQ